MVVEKRTKENVSSSQEGALAIRAIGGRIGAEIEDLDLHKDISDDIVAAIRNAVNKYKVVFIVGQKLDYDSQLKFATRFGAIASGHPIFKAPEEKPFLRAFDSSTGIRANHWHSDLTFLPDPPAYAFLRSVKTPPAGGDTMWSNGVAAFDSMPPELRELAEKLRIVHSNDCDYIDATMPASKRDYVATLFETEHSAVQLHPETGEKYLLLGGFAKYVVGYDPQTSRALLDLLTYYAMLPENIARWRWTEGDLVIWDNLATQHYAVYDYGKNHRLTERITVKGQRMIGADGKVSIAHRP